MKIRRFSANPIMTPNSHWWESKAVFNAAAATYDGKVYLLYRAVGEDQVSRFGLATSDDGIHFDRHSGFPAYECNDGSEYERFGCEDPRITPIDGTFYITYVGASIYPANHPKPAFAGGAPWRCRVGLLSTADFRSFKKHGFILPDQDNKDVVLFPEKIRGRYAIIHRAFPNMWLAYSDDLINWTDHVPFMSARHDCWDSDRLGAGAPPIRTEHGWLELYHGVDENKCYHLGAALLDIEDPTKILARSKMPLLSPEEEYERVGLVPNIVFTCGVVERDDEYLIYYGGADRVVAGGALKKKDLFNSPDIEWFH